MWGEVEGWALLLLAVFQAFVAFLWSKAPWPRTIVAVVVGLFVLNGAATGLNGLTQLGYLPDATLVARVLDRWTNVFLLALPMTALTLGTRGRAAALTLIGSAAILLGMQLIPADRGLSWAGALVEVPLLLAMPATAIAMRAHLRQDPSAARTAWILILAVLAMRFADLSVSSLVAPGTSPIPSALQTLRLLGLASMLALAGMLLAARPGRQLGSQVLDAALLLVVSGLLLGAARAGVTIASAVLFSLALVRPVGFVVALSVLEPRASHPIRQAATAAALLMVSLGGFLLGDVVWGLSASSSGLLAIVLPMLAFPILARAGDGFLGVSRRGPGSEGVKRARDPQLAAWGLEDRVPLPADWKARLERSERAYERLPARVREGLFHLARWERILLTLAAVSKVAPSAYERTTPGLHFATQCPYSAIGSEIARCNARWEAILAELRLSRPRLPVDASQSLIRGTWGRAEGLRSDRVKSYEITPLGADVAAALVQSLGIGGVDASLVVGEALGRSTAKPPDSEVLQR